MHPSLPPSIHSFPHPPIFLLSLYAPTYLSLLPSPPPPPPMNLTNSGSCAQTVSCRLRKVSLRGAITFGRTTKEQFVGHDLGDINLSQLIHHSKHGIWVCQVLSSTLAVSFNADDRGFMYQCMVAGTVTSNDQSYMVIRVWILPIPVIWKTFQDDLCIDSKWYVVSNLKKKPRSV